MNFCPDCGDLMVVDTTTSDDKLYFLCKKDKKKYKAKESDYTILNEDFTKPRSMDALLQYAPDNITNPRIKKKCPKCDKERIVTVIRKKNSLTAIYICNKCRYSF